MRFRPVVSFLCLVLFHIAIWQCCCNQVSDFRVSYLNKCWPRDNYFTRIFGVSLQICVEECVKRQICKGMNYRRKVKQCELIPTTTTTADLVVNTLADGPCISVHRIDIQTQTTCNCPTREVCDLPGNCKVQECSPFSITNGNFLGDLNNIDARVKFTCDSGYTELNDESTATCLVNGSWSVIPQCNIGYFDCGSVTIENGIATVDNGTTVSNIATITCNCGYKLQGADTLTCTPTGWDKASPTCEAWNPQCSVGFQLYCGSCYLFDTAEYKWEDAWTKCKDEHKGNLVHIENKAENDWLVSKCRINTKGIFWINLSDRFIEGKWIWNDTDTEAKYTNWGENEAKVARNENCASIHSVTNYQWADLPCGLNTISAICERETNNDEFMKAIIRDGINRKWCSAHVYALKTIKEQI